MKDAANFVLGLWLVVSPWVLTYTTTTTAAQNAWVVGAVIAIAALAALLAFHQWEEWVNVALAAWLFVSPWILGFSGQAVFVSELGLSLFAHQQTADQGSITTYRTRPASVCRAVPPVKGPGSDWIVQQDLSSGRLHEWSGARITSEAGSIALLPSQVQPWHLLLGRCPRDGQSTSISKPP